MYAFANTKQIKPKMAAFNVNQAYYRLHLVHKADLAKLMLR